MQVITVKHIEEISFVLAQQMLEWGEPIPDFNTRFPNVLEGCLKQPFQTWGKKDLYPSLESKASILFYLMNKNHPFRNGNKRIALMTLLYILVRQKKWVKVDAQTLYNMALWVAESPPDAYREVVAVLERFIKKNMIDLPADD